MTLPADGLLTLNGVAINAGDEIRKRDIDNGLLVFTPDEGESGSSYTPFTFSVGACGALEGEPTNTITIQIIKAPAPQAPAAPTVTKTEGSEFSLDVRWTAPDNTHCPGGCPEITHYELQYRRGTGGSWESWTDGPQDVTDTRTTITVPDLTSRYQVRVRAVNAEGTAGAWSRPGLWLPPGELASSRLTTAWLSRFGRTVADQVIDAVGARLQAPADPAGLQASMAGHRLVGTLPRETGPAQYHSNYNHYDAWYGAGDGAEPEVRTRDLSGQEILRSSSFSYRSGDEGAGMLSVWGRGATTSFDGRDEYNSGNVEVDGKVQSLMLGTDFRQVKGVFGALLAHSSGTGDYRGESDGDVRLSLTGVYPYASYEVREDLSLWGIAGFGKGEVKPTREGESLASANIDLLMAAAGLRSRLPELTPNDPSFPSIAAVADVMAVRVRSDGFGDLRWETDAEVSRLRAGLEGAWDTVAAWGGWMTPVMRIGLRADRGDAERGFGTDVEGRLHWSNPPQGVQMQLRAHGLLSHKAGRFRERSLSGSISWDPDPASRWGATFRLTGGVSDTAMWGLDSLLGNPGGHDVTATGKWLGGESDSGRGHGSRHEQVRARVGYGFGVFEDRFTGIPELGMSWTDESRDYSVGWRLLKERSDAGAFEILLEATHREDTDDGESRDGIGFRLRAYW